MCFITGQAAAANELPDVEADVDGGKTTLTSPVIDLTAVAIP